jgi:hypothetical protein
MTTIFTQLRRVLVLLASRPQHANWTAAQGRRRG